MSETTSKLAWHACFVDGLDTETRLREIHAESLSRCQSDMERIAWEIGHDTAMMAAERKCRELEAHAKEAIRQRDELRAVTADWFFVMEDKVRNDDQHGVWSRKLERARAAIASAGGGE